MVSIFLTNVLAQEYKELSQERPLHFLGLVPGANCQMKYQLDLFENRVFFLREECFKDGVSSGANDDIGRWYADNDNRVVLNPTKTKVKYFLILDEKSIELMDLKGNKIDSKLNYKLLASNRAKSLEPRLILEGAYSYMADAGLFYECSTGLKFPLAFEEDNIALEKAYLNAVITPNQSLKTQLKVRIAGRKQPDSVGNKATIIVEEFLEIIPKEKCQNPYSKAKLQNTYWKLTKLNLKPLSLSKSMSKETHMILDKGLKFKGNTGCNSMSGTYKIKGEKFSFSEKIMMSRMMCRGSIEKEFIEVLKKVDTYKVKGEYLELFDVNGLNIARFESVYLY